MNGIDYSRWLTDWFAAEWIRILFFFCWEVYKTEQFYTLSSLFHLDDEIGMFKIPIQFNLFSGPCCVFFVVLFADRENGLDSEDWNTIFFWRIVWHRSVSRFSHEKCRNLRSLLTVLVVCAVPTESHLSVECVALKTMDKRFPMFTSLLPIVQLQRVRADPRIDVLID